ncbi:MAG: virulence protein RhuM/Fic/DOC family protein [Deltaproteobacteria bacterium]|nr:virulence protein RhuM/Fic/DOC family protein [Deltaproteobacteria bacterium]
MKKAKTREAPIVGKGEIVLYKTSDGKTALDVRLEQETLWLTLNQIAMLFDRDKSVISRHLRNTFKTGELVRGATVAKIATVQMEGDREVVRQVEYFNLDAILSVGYRVNSLRGTHFRIWATNVLRDHILKGYSVNQRRLKELRQSLKLVGNVLDRYDVTTDQAKALMRVVTDYSYALDLLDDYDYQRVTMRRTRKGRIKSVSYEETIKIIAQLRKAFGASDLFGKEKDGSLEGSLQAVMQTFDGREVYPSLEEKAAHLLYFLVKNHSFVDGNKRIAAAVFLWFMEKNGALYRKDASKRIADNALVAITLMIAESRPAEMDVMVKLIVNLINSRN